MTRALLCLTLAVTTGCASQPVPSPADDAKTHVLVLPYADFGPQVAAHRVLGMAWWQWENHGDDRRTTPYPIKVVVYAQLTPAEVAAKYPVDQAREQDYRYLSVEAALQYLDAEITENIDPPTTAVLAKTRALIQTRLGVP